MLDQNDENVMDLYIRKKSIYFEIEETKYHAIVSIDELLIPTIEKGDNFDYRKYVSSILLDAIDSELKPMIAQVILQDDQFFIKIFDCFLANNTEFYAVYNEINCTEICERYSTAYFKYSRNNFSKSSMQISKSFSENMTALSKIASAVFKSIEPIDFSFLNSLSEIINTAMSWCTNNADIIQSGMKAALLSFSEISKSVTSSIFQSLQNIHIPEISEERKQKLLKSYEQWGKYGWTVPPFDNISFFNNCPATLIEADQLALKYCKKTDMQMLFSLLEDNCTRKRDIRESICCYNAHQYKACALILFSLIDSRLIRLQKRVKNIVLVLVQ